MAREEKSKQREDAKRKKAELVRAKAAAKTQAEAVAASLQAARVAPQADFDDFFDNTSIAGIATDACTHASLLLCLKSSD